MHLHCAYPVLDRRNNFHVSPSLHIQFDCLVAYPAFGGRLDQTMANINTMFQLKEKTKKPCYLITDDDIAFLVDKV